MNDLERELRDLLRDDAHHVAAPGAAPHGLRRAARWRQMWFTALVAGTTLALVVAIVAGASLLLPLGDDSVPAGQPTTTQTLNGITITFPESWHLIDPDAAGLNGPDPTQDLPRLVLALSPQEANDLLACPGQVQDEPPTFLMTVQEQPMSLTGTAADPWPATLAPTPPGGDGSGCYPGWTFEQASWTTGSRTFRAVVGLAPAISDADRTALFAAFDSLTFAQDGEGPTSAVIATGTTGDEDWQLIASSGAGGLSLSIQTDTFGAGGSSGDPVSEALALASHVFGSGEGAERLVYAAVPAEAVRIVGTDADGTATEIPILDIPDGLDERANAFVVEIPPDGTIAIQAFDADGAVVAHGRLGQELGGPIQGVAALEDGRHFGYIHSVDVEGRTVEFDLAYWLSGEEANQAYQEATGDTGPVPNDHFVVNDNPRLRTLPLAQDLRLRLLDWNRCCDTFFDGDLALFAQAVASQRDITDDVGRIYSGVSQWWITVENGVVTEIEEQYSP